MIWSIVVQVTAARGCPGAQRPGPKPETPAGSPRGYRVIVSEKMPTHIIVADLVGTQFWARGGLWDNCSPRMRVHTFVSQPLHD